MLPHKPRILIVDDELGPREALRMILSDDYDVVAASNGNQAMENLSRLEFDLVILDIRMPDISGIDLLAEVRKKAPDTEVVMITAYASVDTATNALRLGALDYLIKPFDRHSVKEAVEKGLSRRSKTKTLKSKLDELELVNESLKAEAENAYNNIHKHYTETVRSLVTAIDAKDSYTKGHQERVAIYAMLLAVEVNLSVGEMSLLQQAAVLHDIGKIGVLENILRKKGPLTPEEFKLIKQHPVIGAGIISPVEFLKEAVPIVLHHHEKFDGTGYPRGLKGLHIPEGARIITIADAVDAMLTERPYAQAKTPSQVREQLLLCSGTQFDPRLVRIALKIDLPSRRIL
ncbi:MAG: response regulator [Dethiobacter sp.]|jgi:response regulator RpfG family c-di-GMP phosphodiesterase|nr:MAG: response regulator [Dethiobacter sp.]